MKPCHTNIENKPYANNPKHDGTTIKNKCVAQTTRAKKGTTWNQCFYGLALMAH